MIGQTNKKKVSCHLPVMRTRFDYFNLKKICINNHQFFNLMKYQKMLFNET